MSGGSGPHSGPSSGPSSGASGEASGDITDAELSASPLAANLVGGDEGRANSDHHRPRMRSGGAYSRFVSSMKILLPFLALGLIALIVVWPQLKSEDTFRIGFSSVRLTGSAQPGVDNARYMGTDENRQPYSITADLARISAKVDGLISLEMPKADLTLEDGTWLVLTADNGQFMEGEQQLDLEGNVNLFHDTGYEISTGELVVDLKKNVAESKMAVAGHGPFGELTSAGLKLVDKGRVIYFTGPANLILYPSQGEQNTTTGAPQ